MEMNKINKKLRKLGFQVIEMHDSISSTNDRAIEIINEEGLDLGIIIAEYQASGRGRGGRRWEMPSGAGLAFSMILGVNFEYENILGRVTGVGALAVSQAVNDLFDISPEIKWPNDVLIDGKKFCGILTEATWAGNNLKAVIVGIGINLSDEAIPPETIFKATALEVEYHEKISKEDLLLRIVSNFIGLWDGFSSSQIIREWDKILAFKGEIVKLHKDGEEVCVGKLIGLDDNGGIVILTDKDQKNIFYYGDLHLAVK